MTQLKIYGLARTRAHRVLWIAHELGLEYEHVAIETGLGGARKSEYLAVNPNGRLCKRNAPRAHMVTVGTDVSIEARWPETVSDDWCGQHDSGDEQVMPVYSVSDAPRLRGHARGTPAAARG